MFISALAAAYFVTAASAHATFQDFWINGVDQGACCVRLPLSNNPVTDVTSNDIACNVNATPTSGICTVPAGSTVTVEMHQQPGDRTCANEAIGGDHYGPMQVYLAKVSDATTAVGSSQSWFKIGEIGLVSDNPDYWGTEVLNDNCGHYTVTIPKDIANGNYLLRAEVIALHVASGLDGAQFYMSCYQINITGGGTATPAGVSLPGAYSATDPGILINIYQQLNSYTIPGPAPYETASPTVAATAWPTTATWNTALQPTTVPTGMCTAAATTAATTTGTAKTTTSTTSSSTAKVTTTTTTTKATTTSTTPASTATGTIAIYGQCGGSGWTGGTVCISSTCTYVNAYYSQCL
ncbi:hypothetical protein FRB94_011813 [Tulasnella sp. JGI-2019a]|nr:hypothetical protein FRB94_011813 [Tulasnella sp. JGI-2019a]KAG9038971.1 hypothetical protein FRB95_013649 [Tulasnella sp. JGI-2019a]